MKILFDQNLSPKLAVRLQDVYPGSSNVRHQNLRGADDWEIWNFAAVHGIAIASKDTDFLERSLIQGPPPKVIYVGVGNCTTDQIETLIRIYQDELDHFADAPHLGVIELI
jgi:predicted nuclease of predicted toxin-antitoxin system